MEGWRVIKSFPYYINGLVQDWRLQCPLQWHHNGHDSVSNHQSCDCFLNRLLRRRSKKTSKLRVTGLCAGKSPETGEFPAEMASNAEMFPFDDVIMLSNWVTTVLHYSIDIRVSLQKTTWLCCVLFWLCHDLTHCGLVTPYGDIDLGN